MLLRDVALLLGVLVRLDGQPLDRLRVEPTDDQRGEEPHADGQCERPRHPRERRPDEQGSREPGQDGQDVVGEELGVLVGVGHARRDAAGAVRELVLVELVAERDRQQEQPAEDAEVDPDRRRERRARRATPPRGSGCRRPGVAMTMPLNSAWMRRRNGSSNRKNPMSRPNTGSTTGGPVSARRGRDLPRAGSSTTPPRPNRRSSGRRRPPGR